MSDAHIDALVRDIAVLLRHVEHRDHRYDYATHIPGPTRNVVSRVRAVADVDALSQLICWVEFVSAWHWQSRPLAPAEVIACEAAQRLREAIDTIAARRDEVAARLAA